MAESGLSVGWPELVGAVGDFLGYGYKTYANYSTSQKAEISRYVQSGIRRVYFPPAIKDMPPDMIGYEWSWMQPTTTLDIEDGEGDYDLPDDLGRVLGNFYYPAAEYKKPIYEVSIGKILAMRSSYDRSGPPYCYATRFKEEDRTTGSRKEVLFYPEPDDDWTLSYEYEAYSGALGDDYPYPLGGMKLGELYIESCLAVAESRGPTEEIGQHTAVYQSLLIDAIVRDRKQGATFYGQMGDHHIEPIEFHRGNDGTTAQIYYNGELLE